jgi:acyl-CoA reductase-like NAD-dependent aldehyde dehydrogenase
MERAVELLLRQVDDALDALRARPGTPATAPLDTLEALLRTRLRPTLAAGDLANAAHAARELEAAVAALPLPGLDLDPRERAEVLAAMVELLRAAAGLHHQIASQC